MEFKSPFRLGKKQERAVLDSLGHELVVFPKNRENFAEEYVHFLNQSRFIWIITDEKDGFPIIAASSKELAEQQLFDYMGYKEIDTEELKYLGYTSITYSEHEDNFIGIYRFNGLYPNGFGENIKFEWEIQEFNLFSLVLNASQK